MFSKNVGMGQQPFAVGCEAVTASHKGSHEQLASIMDINICIASSVYHVGLFNLPLHSLCKLYMILLTASKTDARLYYWHRVTRICVCTFECKHRLLSSDFFTMPNYLFNTFVFNLLFKVEWATLQPLNKAH